MLPKLLKKNAKQEESQGQAGFALVAVIAAMVIISALGAGILGFGVSSKFSQLSDNNGQNADYIAVSGYNLAVGKILGGSEPLDLDDTSYSLDTDSTVHLEVHKVGTSNTFSVKSTGTIERDQNNKASSIYTGLVTAPSDIVDSDTGAFSAMRFVGDNARREGEGLAFGELDASGKGKSGAAWYVGYDAGARHGKTPFKNGIRAYFEFKFAPSSTGDGFVFVVRGADNGATSVDLGGDPLMGELMGYAGDGPDGKGIPYPKFGLEFDIFGNGGDGNICQPGSRNDTVLSNDVGLDHVAYVFWGDDPTRCGGGAKKLIETYDDNRHGAGGSQGLLYPYNDSGRNDYYNKGVNWSDWLKKGGTFYCRMEIHRSTKPESNGSYKYSLRTWLTQESPSSQFRDVRNDYTAKDSILERTLYLDERLHDYLDNIFFGYTFGTGLKTELVTINDLKLGIRNKDVSGPVPNDYVGYWPFDEYEYKGNSGNAWATPDISGNGNNLKLFGQAQKGSAHVGPTLWLEPSVWWGKKALGRVDINNDALNLRDSGTIMFWISNAGQQSSYSMLVGAANSYSIWMVRDPLFGQDCDIVLSITNGNQSTTLYTEKFLLPPSPYTMIVASWDVNAKRMDLYVFFYNVYSGKYTKVHEQSRLTHSASNIDRGDKIFIGASNESGDYGYRGNVDELYIYKRALMEEEISSYYESIKGR